MTKIETLCDKFLGNIKKYKNIIRNERNILRNVTYI